VPILQLANFAIPLTQTVCGLADQQPPATVPADGVAVYVADLQATADIPSLQSACPSFGNPALGLPQVFYDTGHHTDYAAIGVAGPDASDADLTAARDYIASLSNIEVTAAPPPSNSGPGYVMASGAPGDTSWRLEAGMTSMGARGGPGVGAIMITTDSAGADARTVELPTQQRIADDAVDLGADGFVQFGTATTDVTGVDVDAPSGTVPATMFAWPANALSADLTSRDGWIWFARTPERGDVRASFATTPTTAPTPSVQPEAGRVQTSTDAQGRYTISGNDLGHDWSFHREQDGTFAFFLDDVDQAQGVELTPGAETYFDIPGGTLALALEPASVTRLFVTSDVAGNDVVANGAWAPSSLGSEPNARVWIEALPGSGSGYQW
jgi:hypothetical protein